MPATARRIPGLFHVLGVDGCRAGWIVASRALPTGEMSVAIADRFGSILDGPGKSARAIIVDIPIGLAATGARACEIDARRLIGPRRSSVFASPRRSMLNFDLFDEANAWGKANGAGLSKQCWGMVPKIREADQRMSPDLQTKVGEGHPEVAFTRLRGAPCVHSKRTSEGLSERRAALIGAGLASVDDMLSGLREKHPLKKDFAADDFYDACALALTAQARLEGAAWRLGDGARDERGLIMEIWG